MSRIRHSPLRRATRRGLAVAFLALAVVPFAWAGAFPHTASGPLSKQVACGNERWDVKTLKDAAASGIDFGNVKASTVTKLGQIHSSTHTPARRPEERQVYRVKVILDSLPGKKLGYKIEPNDSDIHLAVRDAAGKTMIAEFPDPGCTSGAQQRFSMKTARDALVAACGKPAKGTFTELHGTATITGVLFFDFFHHQRGVSLPNVVELHPVLSFTRASCHRA
jgi:hypothetical protein